MPNTYPDRELSISVDQWRFTEIFYQIVYYPKNEIRNIHSRIELLQHFHPKFRRQVVKSQKTKYKSQQNRTNTKIASILLFSVTPTTTSVGIPPAGFLATSAMRGDREWIEVVAILDEASIQHQNSNTVKEGIKIFLSALHQTDHNEILAMFWVIINREYFTYHLPEEKMHVIFQGITVETSKTNKSWASWLSHQRRDER